MLAPLFLFMALASGAGGITGPYEVRFVAYDAQGHPLYQRPAWVFVGPPEALGERPPPPPDTKIQGFDFSLRLTTVPAGDFCVFPQTATEELGRLVTFECEGVQP